MGKKHETNNDSELLTLKETVSDIIEVSDISLCASSPDFYNNLQKKYPNNFHNKLILNLTHKSMPELEAKLLWKKMIKHMHELDDTLQRNVGIIVATADYLTNIDTTIIKPILIDEKTRSDIVLSSIKDELTNLHTKEFLDDALNKEIEAFHRTKTSFCFIMIDIDDFKKINDRFGHPKGDEVLAKIGAIINSHARKMDVAARFGGEEFSIIMPQCSMNDGKNASERIRAKVEQSSFVDDINVTVSIGVSCMDEKTHSKERLIEHADIALYEAKGHEKNQVSLYPTITAK